MGISSFAREMEGRDQVMSSLRMGRSSLARVVAIPPAAGASSGAEMFEILVKSLPVLKRPARPAICLICMRERGT